MATRRKRIKAQQLVLVRWNDAASSATQEFEAGRDHKAVVMETVGWLMRGPDECGVSVATERYHEDGALRFRGWTFVPAGMVVSVEPL